MTHDDGAGFSAALARCKRALLASASVAVGPAAVLRTARGAAADALAVHGMNERQML